MSAANIIASQNIPPPRNQMRRRFSMSAANVRPSENVENPVVELLLRASKHNRNRIITKLKREWEKAKGDDKALVELALALLGEPRSPYPFDRVFQTDFEAVISKKTTTAQFKCAVLDHLFFVATKHVVRQARKYDKSALPVLAKHSIALVTELNTLARNVRGRDSLLPFSQQVVVWPVLKSEHVHFNQNENDYLGTLRVGHGLNRNFSNNARWKPGTIADLLWGEIQSARMPRIYFPGDKGIWLVGKASALPDFNIAGAADKWAALAFDLCVRQMKTDKGFHSDVKKIIPKTKRERGEGSWLRGYLKKKFRYMQAQTPS